MKKRTVSLLCLSATAAAVSICTTLPASADATGSVIYNMPSGTARSALTEVSPGLFYGCRSTYANGGVGQIYSITPTGTYSLVTQFLSSQGLSTSNLIVGKNGDYIYGTTGSRSTSTGNDIFKMTASGTVSIMQDLSGSGLEPNGVTQARNGSLYGTSIPNGSGSAMAGTFYKVTTGGVYTPLYTFPIGYDPTPVVQASDGNFYGCELHGEDQEDPEGNIFQLTGAGVETTLSNDVTPFGLTLNADGSAMFADFYFSSGGIGFLRLDPPNTISDISSGTELPYSRLVLGPDGNFYGYTQRDSDGTYDNTLIFRVTPDGVKQNIYEAASVAGSYIYGLCVGSDGNIYGVGTSTIFSVNLSSPPIDPVISTIAPRKVTVGGPAFTLTVHGSDFQPSTQIVVDTEEPYGRSSYYILTPTTETPKLIKVTVRADAIARKFKAYVYALDPTTTDQSDAKPLLIVEPS